jgi:hypothetical protein
LHTYLFNLTVSMIAVLIWKVFGEAQDTKYQCTGTLIGLVIAMDFASQTI